MTIWLRFADLKARNIVRNRVTLSRWIKNIDFPPGIMIGPNTRGWSAKAIAEWEAKCPIVRLEGHLREESILDDSEIERITGEIDVEIEDAFAFATESPLPAAQDLIKNLYRD